MNSTTSLCGPPHSSRTPATARTRTPATASKTGDWPTSCKLKAEMTAHSEEAEPHQPAYGAGARPLPRYRTRPLSLRDHVLATGRRAGRTLTWCNGSKAAMRSHFVLLRVRLAGHRLKPATDGTIPLVWLLAQWPEDEAEPVRNCISNLPAGIPAKGP